MHKFEVTIIFNDTVNGELCYLDTVNKIEAVTTDVVLSLGCVTKTRRIHAVVYGYKIVDDLYRFGVRSSSNIKSFKINRTHKMVI